jgi:small neutral amino acid transporter SnatA (MarC family)
MAKGFFAEATNGTFMPAQAIEMLRVRTKRPKSKSENAIDLASDAYAPLDSPGNGPHTQTTAMLRQATTVTAVSTRALCAVAVSGLGIVLLILPH